MVFAQEFHQGLVHFSVTELIEMQPIAQVSTVNFWGCPTLQEFPNIDNIALIGLCHFLCPFAVDSCDLIGSTFVYFQVAELAPSGGIKGRWRQQYDGEFVGFLCGSAA